MTLATIGNLLLLIATGLVALGWLRQLAQWLCHFRELTDLTRISLQDLPSLPDQPGGRPHLTVVVPACNEEDSVAITLRSLLASTGIRLQIIAVDDRSTDRTGSILDEIFSLMSPDQVSPETGQTGSHIFQVLHIRQLPPGWLGKPHALASAARLAQADWILFTDADVFFAPHAASLAMRYALMEQADHLVVMPDWIKKTHGEAAMHGAIHALTTWSVRLWRVANPKARDFLGVGAFNLVRRGVYEALGGFGSLRMEVVEDLRFGWMLKRAGYRQRVALGPGLAAVRWSHGAWGVVLNLEKNLFALYRFKIGIALLVCFGLALQIVLPIAAIWAGGWPRAAAIVLYAAVAGLYIACRKFTTVAPAYVLVYPLATTLLLFAMLRSMTLALVRGGVVWRGTLYSLKELRAHCGGFW